MADRRILLAKMEMWLLGRGQVMDQRVFLCRHCCQNAGSSWRILHCAVESTWSRQATMETTLSISKPELSRQITWIRSTSTPSFGQRLRGGQSNKELSFTRMEIESIGGNYLFEN